MLQIRKVGPIALTSPYRKLTIEHRDGPEGLSAWSSLCLSRVSYRQSLSRGELAPTQFIPCNAVREHHSSHDVANPIAKMQTFHGIPVTVSPLDDALLPPTAGCVESLPFEVPRYLQLTKF
ncbi:hypothetical protein DPSP01_003325 [Paraphaeosphaeria sporulosa]